MTEVTCIDHVQLTVPVERVPAALHFYGELLGLSVIDKPEELKRNAGAWYQIGATQLHISGERLEADANASSKRHVCFMVDDLKAYRQRLERLDVDIIEDKQPVKGFERFYLRDPGGNRLEVAIVVEE